MAKTSSKSGEDLDRELIEFLNELRVALPGVQVLFAFLLTVPFTQVFGKVTDFQRDVFFATLVCVALASVLLIAPSPMHRLLFRTHDKEFLLRTANRIALTGLFLLGLGMSGCMLLIADMLFGRELAAVVGSLFFVGVLVLWYALPVGRKAARD